VIEISRSAYAQMVGAALDAYPFEACGLIAGPPAAGGGAGDRAPIFYPCANAAASARVYTIDPMDHLRAERDADDRDFEINGVVHSHTHSEPYPSPTDVASSVRPPRPGAIASSTARSPKSPSPSSDRRRSHRIRRRPARRFV
jgi:proteasome lid subunit RPN8/RPN11